MSQSPKNPSDSGGPVQVIPQTGMPTIYQKRSREVIYDALGGELKFVKNPFGPQLLILSRPNHRW
jgi:hypothetical protein